MIYEVFGEKKISKLSGESVTSAVSTLQLKLPYCQKETAVLGVDP